MVFKLWKIRPDFVSELHCLKRSVTETDYSHIRVMQYTSSDGAVLQGRPPLMTQDDNWSYYSQNTPYYGEGMVKMFYDILAEVILKLSLVAVYNRWLQGSSGSRSLLRSTPPVVLLAWRHIQLRKPCHVSRYIAVCGQIVDHNSIIPHMLVIPIAQQILIQVKQYFH